jgi:diguanylate cyclase (GGDEF)-like protein
VLLPETDSDGALDIGEKIRKNIEDSEVMCGETVTKLTVSIGINTHRPTHESSVNMFITGADEALYTAKREGRNKVCLYAR